MKEKGFSLAIPKGVKTKLHQLTDGSWSWEISIFRNKLADGHETTREAAMLAVKKALGPAMIKSGQNAQTRSILKQKLKYWAKGRPYACAFFFEGYARGLNLAALCEGAEAGEEGRWETDAGQPWRPELPTHGKAKSAESIMMELWQICAKLGWDGKQADAWARDFYGVWYFNPGATFEQAVEVYPLKKKKSEDEVDG